MPIYGEVRLRSNIIILRAHNLTLIQSCQNAHFQILGVRAST